jgi:hypothetical protein
VKARVAVNETINSNKDTRSSCFILEVANPGLVLICSQDLHSNSVAPGLRRSKRGGAGFLVWLTLPLSGRQGAGGGEAEGWW